jgi:hypothetical protein
MNTGSSSPYNWLRKVAGIATGLGVALAAIGNATAPARAQTTGIPFAPSCDVRTPMDLAQIASGTVDFLVPDGGAFTIKWQTQGCRNGNIAAGAISVITDLRQGSEPRTRIDCKELEQVQFLGKEQPHIFVSALCLENKVATLSRLWVYVSLSAGKKDDKGPKWIGGFVVFDPTGQVLTYASGTGN